MDFFEALGHKHYQALEIPDDDTLRSLYIDRIYDTYIDEEKLQETDFTIGDIANGLEPRPYSSREFIREMGKWLTKNGKKDNSLVKLAYEHDVPIFCPAFTDSSAGFGLVKHQVDAMKQGRRYMTLDSIADFRELTDIKIQAGDTGLLMIGGGVPKNFVQDTVVCAEILGHDDVAVHKYAVQITVADVRDGACSSSTLQEAASWGKVSTAMEQMVFAEATSVLPLMASDAYHRGHWKTRAKRQLFQAVRLMRRGIAALAIAAFIASSPADAARQAADLVIRNATIVDMARERSIPGQAVAVRGGEIVATGHDKAIARQFTGTRSIDAHGKFVMPGLWDMHMHFGGGPELIEENKALLPVYVAFGVTSVRDAAADISDSVFAWRDQVAAGTLLGPTIYTSGPKLEGYKPLWKGTIEVGTPAEVEAALDRLQAVKVDFVKITDNTLKPEIFLYAVGAAKKRGLKTSAHTPFALTIEQAAAAGLSSVEHIDYLIKAGSTEEERIGADYAAGKISYAAASDRFVETFDATNAKPGLSPPCRDRAVCHAHFEHGPDTGLSRSRRSFKGSGARAGRSWLTEDLCLAG